jgi:hypothetical protein
MAMRLTGHRKARRRLRLCRSRNLASTRSPSASA